MTRELLEQGRVLLADINQTEKAIAQMEKLIEEITNVNGVIKIANGSEDSKVFLKRSEAELNLTIMVSMKEALEKQLEELELAFEEL